eukprot:gene6295-7546_t
MGAEAVMQVDRGERIETQLEEEKKKARMEARARNREQRAENMMQAAKLPSHFRKQIAGLGKASFE